MKKILILCFIFSTNIVFAQLTYVPDDNFEQALIELGYDDVLDDYVLTTNIEKVTTLDVSYRFIYNLTGIEDFTALTELSCYSNQLTNLDVSQNTNLTVLSCAQNQLTNLDVSQHNALYYLNCSANQLTTLDVSQNTALIYIVCVSNQLTSLDVSQNLALTHLLCGSNQLTNLDVSQNATLSEFYCSGNHLNSLDVSQNLDLTRLSCFQNQLTSLDVSQNVSLTEIHCNKNLLTTLDFSQNLALSELKCHYNQLTNLDIRNGNNTNIAIGDFDATSNPNLTCIFVDDAAWSSTYWTNVDPASTFVETQAECDALGIEEEIIENDIQVYPNPTDETLNFRLTNEIEIINAVLYNYLGNVITRTNKSFMDVSELKTGIYMLRIITSNNELISQRVIIEND